MDTSTKWIVDYDSEPGYASFSKTFKTEEEAKKEAERLEKKGLYVFGIRKYDLTFWLDLQNE